MPNWVKGLLILLGIEILHIISSSFMQKRLNLTIPSILTAPSSFIESLQQSPIIAEQRISKLVK